MLPHIEKLSRESFAAYGQVIDAPPSSSSSSSSGMVANQGSATRFNYLAKVQNLRSSQEGWGVAESLKKPSANLNICLFRSKPREMPFHVKLLERHQYSSQMFIPMTSNEKAAYLVVVALNDPVEDKPDMSTFKVFYGTSLQAFNYNAGVWHHPMISLYSQVDFVCLVFERNKDQVLDNEDCEEIFFPRTPIILSLEKAHL